MNIVGIMSGTSVDGIDYILCFENFESQLIYKDKAHIKFPIKMKNQILKAAANELDFWSVAQLHYDLGEFYSKSLKKIKKDKKWKIDLIGLHGQTVFHAPKKCSLQIGEASFLKKDFKVPVVSQFRNMNIADHGQGAPFAPFFHNELMKNQKKTWAFQNLGGMGNVTSLQKNKLIAFDTGPANVLIDQFMTRLFKKEYDKDGIIASKGIPDERIVLNFLKHSYFKVLPPKSCGRENFTSQQLKKELKGIEKLCKEDQIATLTEITARTIADQYKKFLKQSPELIVLSGGGAKNKRLVQRIQFYHPKAEVLLSEKVTSWPEEAIEGGAFAWLASQRLKNLKISGLKSVTGSTSDTLLGAVY